METQLVRLDKPYNIICGNNGDFALHIATLLTITEVEQKDEDGKVIGISPLTHCYPVVGGSYKMDGEVWMNTEQKDCLVICREEEPVSLYTLKKVMDYCAKKGVSHYMEKIPTFFDGAMFQFGCRIVLPTDKNNNTISDYEVCLEFEEANDGKTCMAYADKDSDFHFYEYFSNVEEFFSVLQTNSEAVKHMAELRDHYLRILRVEGLRRITFTTKNENYTWFVNQLNSTKPDGM